MAITITKSTSGCSIADTGNKKSEYHVFPFGTITSVSQKHFSRNKTKIVIAHTPPDKTQSEKYEFFYQYVTSPTTATSDDLVTIIQAYNIDNPWPQVFSANVGQTVFTLTNTGDSNIMVFVNGVLKFRNIDYTYDDDVTVTFTAAMGGSEEVQILKIK